jgi:hypothetical protein
MAQTLSPFSGMLFSEAYRLRGTTTAFYSDVGGRDIQKSRRLLRQDRGRQAIQLARDNRRRNGRLSKQDAGGTVFVVHVFAGRRVGISARHFWHGSEGTQGIDAETLKTGRRDALYWPITTCSAAVADGRFRGEADIDRFWRALHMVRLTHFGHRPRLAPLVIGVHSRGDFGHTFCRTGLVPIATWRSADAEPSYDLVAVLDCDTARLPTEHHYWIKLAHAKGW